MCVNVKIFMMFCLLDLITKTQNRRINIYSNSSSTDGTKIWNIMNSNRFLSHSKKKSYHKQKSVLLFSQFSGSYIYIYGREMFSVSHHHQQPRTRALLIQSDPTRAPFQDKPQIFWLWSQTWRCGLKCVEALLSGRIDELLSLINKWRSPMLFHLTPLI